LINFCWGGGRGKICPGNMEGACAYVHAATNAK
jgi:hypothetical protein